MGNKWFILFVVIEAIENVKCLPISTALVQTDNGALVIGFPLPLFEYGTLKTEVELLPLVFFVNSMI